MGNSKPTAAPPPGWFRAHTAPWWRRTICSTIAKPSPDPGSARAAVDR
jgi:hypothetical protein